MLTPPYEEVRLIWNEEIAAMPDVVMENIEEYYTFTPVDLYFNRVPEGSVEHVYYAVGVRNTVLDLPKLHNVYKLLGLKIPTFQDMVHKGDDDFYIDSKGNRWNSGDPLPNCGFTYRGKPTVHPDDLLLRRDLNRSQIHLNRKCSYQAKGHKGYAISNQDTLCLGCLGIQDLSVIDNFVIDTRFKTLTTAMPKPKQVTLKSAAYAFSLLYADCKSLDLRGLKFDRNTNVENMLRHVSVDTGGGSGLQELILTPAQYRLFTSTNCKLNSDGLHLLEFDFETGKQDIFKAHNLADEDDMIRMGRKLIALEKTYKEERKALKTREFGAYFFGGYYYNHIVNNDEDMEQWEQLKSIIRIQGVDAASSHVCNSELLKDDGGFYTYTPIDGNFQEVAEGSADHVYYGVDFRTHILKEIRNHRCLKGEKAPDTGLHYHGKPVVSLADSFCRYGVDTSLVHKYQVLKCVIRNRIKHGDAENYYLVGLGDEVDTSSVDLSEVTFLRGFLADNQFKKIKLLQPRERYETQVVLEDAEYAFHVYHSCQSLDIRGLKFDRDTRVRGMFKYVSVASPETEGKGLKELILTPEQYALFTSQSCKAKDEELERFHYNANVHRNHALDGSSIRDGETQEEAVARVEECLVEYLEGLESREVGSFFFQGDYDCNRWDNEQWQALKDIIVVQPLPWDEP